MAIVILHLVMSNRKHARLVRSAVIANHFRELDRSAIAWRIREVRIISPGAKCRTALHIEDVGSEQAGQP
jgi:hypothetical protein